MMMKASQVITDNQQQPLPLEENMSILSSSSSAAAAAASGEATSTVSSCNIRAHQHYFAPPIHQSQPSPKKKKRNLPGNPDPDAEVIALSPKSLMATNRFMCEICNKGFQRDQNLQLHRRGHNLPWKLKQRISKEVRKKVYVCPVVSCVHHDPSRALGDLTGIKKHFCRKHGEKKWKCEKCSKRYAVQSDWKAHSKTCGTREYRCDCGTLFSRRDSFITHRAFCDALAEENSRSNPLIIPSQAPLNHMINLQSSKQFFNGQLFVKREEHNFSTNPRAETIPPWPACLGPPPIDLTSSIYDHHQDRFASLIHHETQNPNPSLGGGGSTTLPPYHNPNPHTSATALLQKAAQMGATMSSKSACIDHHHQQQQGHLPSNSGNNNISNNTNGFGLNLSSRDQGLASLGDKAVAAAAAAAAACGGDSTIVVLADHQVPAVTAPPPQTSSFLQEMMMSGFDGSTFEDHVFRSYEEDMLYSKKLQVGPNYFNHNQNSLIISSNDDINNRSSDENGNTNNNNNDDDGMTRDFFGTTSFITQ